MGLNKTQRITVKVTEIKKLTPESAKYCGSDPYHGDHIDNVKVNSTLQQFAQELRRQRGFTECLFGTVHDEARNNKGQGYLYVYFPNEIYVRGVIGHCDTAVGANPTFKYYVQAKSTYNHKTYSHRWQARLAATIDINKAIKNAKTHLRPWTTNDIVKESLGNLGDLISNSARQAGRAAHELNRDIRDAASSTGSLTNELRHLLLTDHKFVDKEVEALLKNYFDKVKNSDAENKRRYAVTLVAIDNVNQEYIVSTSSRPFNPVDNYTNDVAKYLAEGGDVRYTEETLPDDIRFKIASLSMLDFDATSDDEDRFVAGLGWRESEHIFYLVDDYEE